MLLGKFSKKATYQTTNIAPYYVTFNAPFSFDATKAFGKADVYITGKGSDGSYVPSYPYSVYVPSSPNYTYVPGWYGGDLLSEVANYNPLPGLTFPGDWNYNPAVTTPGNEVYYYTPGDGPIFRLVPAYNVIGSGPGVNIYNTAYSYYYYNSPYYGSSGNYNSAVVTPGTQVNQNYYTYPTYYWIAPSEDWYRTYGPPYYHSSYYYESGSNPAYTYNESNPAYSNSGSPTVFGSFRTMSGGYGAAAAILSPTLITGIYSFSSQTITGTVPSGGYVTITVKVKGT